MPPKKAAPPRFVPSKESFFQTVRPLVELSKKEALPTKGAPPRWGRKYIFDKSTGMPTAEIVDGYAVCLDTGERLYSLRKRYGSDDDDDDVVARPAPSRRMDFAPPAGGHHPGEFVVDVLALQKAGILREDVIKARIPFSREQLASMMAELERQRAAQDDLCRL